MDEVHVREDGPDEAVHRSELVMRVGPPRRRRGEEHVRGEPCHGQHGDHRDEAAEPVVRDVPEDPGSDERPEEVREVDAPGGVVVPLQVACALPEVPLQPLGRHMTVEERAVGVDLRAHVRPEQSVGGTARKVVHEQDRGERQPLEHETEQPPAHVGQRERQQPEDDPDQHTVLRQRQPVRDGDRQQRDSVRRRSAPAQESAQDS